MRRALKLHPDAQSSAVAGIEVAIARPRPGRLDLTYRVTGSIGELNLPPAGRAPARGDQLWQHTCFEAFVRAPQGTQYCEFNFAPSLAWAAYRFDDYRSGMKVAQEIDLPRLVTETDDAAYRLHASLVLDRSGLPLDAEWRLGVAAIIEEAGGAKSYWALAHLPGRPDFHRLEGFRVTLGAPE